MCVQNNSVGCLSDVLYPCDRRALVQVMWVWRGVRSLWISADPWVSVRSAQSPLRSSEVISDPHWPLRCSPPPTISEKERRVKIICSFWVSSSSIYWIRAELAIRLRHKLVFAEMFREKWYKNLIQINNKQNNWHIFYKIFSNIYVFFLHVYRPNSKCWADKKSNEYKVNISKLNILHNNCYINNYVYVYMYVYIYIYTHSLATLLGTPY